MSLADVSWPAAAYVIGHVGREPALRLLGTVERLRGGRHRAVLGALHGELETVYGQAALRRCLRTHPLLRHVLTTAEDTASRSRNQRRPGDVLRVGNVWRTQRSPSTRYAGSVSGRGPDPEGKARVNAVMLRRRSAGRLGSARPVVSTRSGRLPGALLLLSAPSGSECQTVKAPPGAACPRPGRASPAGPPPAPRPPAPRPAAPGRAAPGCADGTERRSRRDTSPRDPLPKSHPLALRAVRRRETRAPPAFRGRPVPRPAWLRIRQRLLDRVVS